MRFLTITNARASTHFYAALTHLVNVLEAGVLVMCHSCNHRVPPRYQGTVASMQQPSGGGWSHRLHDSGWQSGPSRHTLRHQRGGARIYDTLLRTNSRDRADRVLDQEYWILTVHDAGKLATYGDRSLHGTRVAHVLLRRSLKVVSTHVLTRRSPKIV